MFEDLDAAASGEGVQLLPERLARACARVLPVQGAGMSLINDEFRVPLGASNDTAAFAERLQFTLGQGPCLHAYRQSEPLRATAADIRRRWPVLFSELTNGTPYRSIVCMPLLRDAPGRGGAIDLYLEDPDLAATLPLGDALVVTDYIASALALSTDEGMSPDPVGPSWLNNAAPRERMQVWVAVGLMTVKLRVGAHDALSLLRAYAYSNNAVLEDIAPQLISGSLPVEQLQR